MSTSSCQRRDPHIEYVIPVGFRGAVVIHADDPTGYALPKVNNIFRCEVPANGVLRVNAKWPLFASHSRTIFAENGDLIPDAGVGESVEPSVVAFWDVGTRPGGVQYYFVGTIAEKREFDTATEANEIHPGKVKK